MGDDIVERLLDGWDLDYADRVEAAAEIQCLADEIKRLHAKAARADELQALIDAYAAAQPDAPRGKAALDAHDALLAAATKEDDRG